MAILLGACGALPVAKRSLCTVAIVSGDTIAGSIEGAGQGLRSAGSKNPCAVPDACMPFLAIVSAGGAVSGGAQGLESGFARAEQNCGDDQVQR